MTMSQTARCLQYPRPETSRGNTQLSTTRETTTQGRQVHRTVRTQPDAEAAPWTVRAYGDEDGGPILQAGLEQSTQRAARRLTSLKRTYSEGCPLSSQEVLQFLANFCCFSSASNSPLIWDCRRQVLLTVLDPVQSTLDLQVPSSGHASMVRSSKVQRK